MIGALQGTPIVNTHNVIVMVHGVGYTVTTPNRVKAKLNQTSEVFLYIYAHIREEAFDLYGFLEKPDLELFKLLISVSGVGPKTAILVMEFSSDQIANAVSKADVSFFTAIPRLGKKNAQKIIIELKSKIGSITELDLTGETDTETDTVIQTLVAMGFTQKEAYQSYRKLPESAVSIEEKIKYCLRELGR